MCAIINFKCILNSQYNEKKTFTTSLQLKSLNSQRLVERLISKNGKKLFSPTSEIIRNNFPILTPN